MKGVPRMTIKRCVLQPALVTEDLRLAAEHKTEELFAALVAAKNEWQYAVKDQDAKYERVLRLKAEYTEWRAMAQRLGELLAEAQAGAASQPQLPAARSGSGFAVHQAVDTPRRTGTRR
jgi:hypothetical protein